MSTAQSLPSRNLQAARGIQALHKERINIKKQVNLGHDFRWREALWHKRKQVNGTREGGEGVYLAALSGTEVVPEQQSPQGWAKHLWKDHPKQWEL